MVIDDDTLEVDGESRCTVSESLGIMVIDDDTLEVDGESRCTVSESLGIMVIDDDTLEVDGESLRCIFRAFGLKKSSIRFTRLRDMSNSGKRLTSNSVNRECEWTVQMCEIRIEG
jgi:hypothetical protein